MLLGRDLHIDAFGDQAVGDILALGADGGILVAIRAGDGQFLAIDGDGGDLVVIDPLDEVGIADLPAVHGRRAVAEQIEQRQDHQKQDDPKGQVACIAQIGPPAESGLA